MASADFCCPIPPPLGGSSLWQNSRYPRVMRVTFTLIPATFTSAVSVQVSDFEDSCLLTQCDRLVCDSCSSGQCFACGFLQISPHGEHPCRSANRSPCRADSGLPPPSHLITTTWIRTAPVKALRAMPGAQQKRAVGIFPHLPYISFMLASRFIRFRYRSSSLLVCAAAQLIPNPTTTIAVPIPVAIASLGKPSLLIETFRSLEMSMSSLLVSIFSKFTM